MLYALILTLTLVRADEVTIEPEKPVFRESAQMNDMQIPPIHPMIEMDAVWLEPSNKLAVKKDNFAIPAGKPSHLAILVNNKAPAKSDTKVQLLVINGELRYPPQPAYVVQNLTSTYLQTTLEPKQQSTISYEFVPSPSLGGQPFVMTVTVSMQDQTGRFFFHSVINETVSVFELEEDPHKNYLSVGFIILVVTMCSGALLWHLTSSKSKAFISSRSSGESVANSTKNEYADLLNKSKQGAKNGKPNNKAADKNK